MENTQDAPNMLVMVNAGDNPATNEETAEAPGIPSAPGSSRCRGLCLFFDNIRHVFRFDDLGREIRRIAIPAALALAADPLASLVDTAFIGRIGFMLLVRVIAVTFCVTMAASLAARQGPTLMAAFQICLQAWLATSLLADGLAIAGQVDTS